MPLQSFIANERTIGQFPLKNFFVFFVSFCSKENLKFDLVADGCVLVELKAVRDVLPIHKAQLLSYMKLLKVPLGL